MRATVTLLPVLVLAASWPVPTALAQATDEPLPELVLDGVIVAQDPTDSIALIRRSGAVRARPLRVGQEFWGHVLLEVRRDSVVLEGIDGALRLALDGLARVAGERGEASSKPLEPAWHWRSFSTTGTRRHLREELSSILSETRISPKRGDAGRIHGLELLEVADGSSLSEWGFFPGDVIVSINGTGLHAVEELWRVLSEKEDGEELLVVVERRGEEVRLAYALTN